MKYLLIILISLGSFPATTAPVAKRPIQDIENLDDLLVVMNKEFFKTNARKEYIKNLKSSFYGANVYQTDMPWSASSSYENTLDVSEPGEVPKVKTGSASLNFRHRSGPQALLRYDMFRTSDVSLSQRFTQDTMRAQVGYDLLQGGLFPSYDLLNDQTNELSQKAQVQSALYSLREQKKQFADQVFNLFVTACLLKDLRVVSKQLDEGKRTAQAQLNTKSIGLRDYLMIANLSESFQIRMEESQQALKSLLFDFENYSDELFQLATDVAQAEKICVIPDKLPTKNVATFDAKTIQQLPEVQQSELQMRASEKSMQSVSALDRPSLVPYVAAVDYKKVSFYSSYHETVLGLTMSYTFGGDSRSNQKKSALESFESSRLQAVQTQRQVDSIIKKMVSEIASQQEIYPIAYQSYQNSLKLIQILNAQKSIGMTDVNSLTNAYQTWSDRVQQLRQIYVTIRKYYLNLELYAQSTESEFKTQ